MTEFVDMVLLKPESRTLEEIPRLRFILARISDPEGLLAPS